MKRYFTNGELVLWFGSCAVIILSFWMFRSRDFLTLAASLIGVTSLIFNAKGNPLGPLLMVCFSLMYGVISYSCAYYGEMITYLGMTMPMAVIALISWLRHPYQGKKTQVKINRMAGCEWAYLALITVVVTVAFYFVLKALHTDALIMSAVSVTTSFAAVYLTFRRSPWYAIAYAANDLVLIVLWVLASGQERAYLSVVICFIIFFINDVYGFINWQNMARQQEAG